MTTFARVVHFSENVDERRLYVVRDPGPFTMADVPGRIAERHRAPGRASPTMNSPLEFIRDLKQAGYALSLDMQSFVRVIGPDREIIFSDVPAKREVVSLLDVVKLDVVEAEILTGTRDLAQAARIFAEWGAKEVLITERSGVVLAVDGQVYREPFTNRTQVGRTGRGDTTISAYLSRRTTHAPLDALRFAAALVSLKMEKPGPFTGTVAEVEQRMAGVFA